MTSKWAMSEQEEFAVYFDKLTSEAKGDLRLYVVRATDKRLLDEVKKGNVLAVTLARCAGEAVVQLGRGRDRHCIACDQLTGGNPGAVVIWLPGRKTESIGGSAIAQPICQSCTRRYSDRMLLQISARFLKQFFEKCEIIEEGDDG